MSGTGSPWRAHARARREPQWLPIKLRFPEVASIPCHSLCIAVALTLGTIQSGACTYPFYVPLLANEPKRSADVHPPFPKWVIYPLGQGVRTRGMHWRLGIITNLCGAGNRGYSRQVQAGVVWVLNKILDIGWNHPRRALDVKMRPRLLCGFEVEPKGKPILWQVQWLRSAARCLA